VWVNSNLDETYRKYLLVFTDDLIRFWRSKVKVTAGRGVGIHDVPRWRWGVEVQLVLELLRVEQSSLKESRLGYLEHTVTAAKYLRSRIVTCVRFLFNKSAKGPACLWHVITSVRFRLSDENIYWYTQCTQIHKKQAMGMWTVAIENCKSNEDGHFWRRT